MPFAHSNGCRIYYRLEGDPARPLLVLVHSLGCDHGMWDPQLPALLPHFQVLRLDLRGHGASDAPAGDYTMEMLGLDVLAAVGARDRFSYCGLSIGGMIGQWIAGHASDRLDRLVLANTSPRAADPAMFETRRTTVLSQGTAAVETAVMQRFFTEAVRTTPAAHSVRTVMLHTDPRGYAGCCAAIRDMDHRPLLDAIRTPTLVIGSDTDQSTPWAGHGDLLAASIPGARTAKLDTAHLSNLEDPSGFNRALVDFLTLP
jgi:3-oxoadipate enol-lactonase